ncbi:MAG: hypothetical protein OWQ48_06795 [Desulfurococcus sp.]|nr:hypothetical protein [Desulfurococcus sp.]
MSRAISRRLPHLAGLGVFTGVLVAIVDLSLLNVVIGLSIFTASILYFYSYTRQPISREEVRSVLQVISLLAALGALLGAVISRGALDSSLTAASIILTSLVTALIARGA